VSLFLAILALGLIIIVHEAGHMVVALWSGMRVERFSIGFGPVIARLKLRGIVFQIAAIPLGGFVQIAGMNPHEQLPADDPGSFENKSLFRRIATIFAGPGTNYLFAFVLCVVLFAVFGVPASPARVPAVIDTVERGSPAEAAGLKPADRVVAVNGEPTEWSEQVRGTVRASRGGPVKVRVARAERTFDVTIRPRQHSDGYRVGIAFATSREWRPLPIGEVLVKAAGYPIEISRLQLDGLWRLVRGEVSTDEVGGPVMIVSQLKSSFDKDLRTALSWMILLNVVVGLMNLLPLPALDGGRLAFLAYNVVTRRRVNVRFEAAVHMVGFVLLFGLIIVITFRDVRRIFGG